ncbi:hypothetical protein ACFL2T_05035, partial [Elusimicrobiota bacterium]
MSKRACAAAALFGGVLLAFWLVVAISFPGGLSFEFCHYGEIGRNLASGAGLRTGVLFPGEAAILKSRGVDLSEPAPVLSRFPLNSLLTGAAILVFGDGDHAVLAVQGALLAGTAATAFWVFSAFLSPPGALAAALLFSLSPSMLRGFALWGYPDLLFCLLLLVFHERWLRRADPWLLGALAALCWLARPNFSLWLPVYAVHAVMAEGRSRETALRLAKVLGSALLVVSPYVFYQARHYGAFLNPNLLWNLEQGVIIPEGGWNYYRLFGYSDFGAEHIAGLLAKGGRGFWGFLSSLPLLWQMGWLLPLAGIGGWAWWRGDRDRRGWLALHLALLAIQVAVFSFLRDETLGGRVAGRYYLWFGPTYCAAAVAGLEWIIQRRSL